MDRVMAVAIYIFIWWIVLFAVLPFGVRTQDEEGSVVPGTPGSAPAKVRIVRIFLINTLVATDRLRARLCGDRLQNRHAGNVSLVSPADATRWRKRRRTNSKTQKTKSKVH